MRCPSCKSGMEALTLVTHLGADVTIDVCWPCHVIWFDQMESTSLSAASVIALFKRIHEAREEARSTVSLLMRCPTCDGGLKLVNDLGKSGRFSYYRCEMGDGRVTSFTQFLREKNFIRTLNTTEIKSLSAQVKQIRCSSCGGPIDLEHDSACKHCGSAISVLDRDAVEKALTALADKSAASLNSPLSSTTPLTQRQEIDAIADALMRRTRPQPRAASSVPAYTTESSGATYDWLANAASWGQATDLIDVGISELVSSLFDL